MVFVIPDVMKKLMRLEMLGAKLGFSKWRLPAMCVALTFFIAIPVAAEEGKLESTWRSWTGEALNCLHCNGWYVEFGVTRFVPNVDSTELTFVEDSTAPIVGTVLPAGPFAGSAVDLAASNIATINLGYMFTEHFGIESILGIPALKFDFIPEGTLTTDPLVKVAIPPVADVQVGPFTSKIGEVKALPITLKGVYYPFPTSRVRPYAGLGLSYTITYDEKITNPGLWTNPNDPSTAPTLETSDELGYVFNAGIDIDVSPKWYVVFDVSYVKLSFDNTISDTIVDGGIVGVLPGSDSTIEVDADPWVYTVGLGRVF